MKNKEWVRLNMVERTGYCKSKEGTEFKEETQDLKRDKIREEE